jgi:DNA-binding response OmpR family regulator
MVANLHDFSNALEHHTPDLVLCEAQTGEADLCRIIQELRRGDGANAFLVVIVTAWAMDAALSNEISKSGADGVILRPFSAAVLDQRIEAHVFRRKPFIVTAGYIGPERRLKGTRLSNAMSFDAPNSLKTKADGRSDPEYALLRFAV